MTQTYIIVTRNPGTGKLFAITGEDNDVVEEFPNEDEAVKAALTIPLCQGWGFLTLRVPQ